MKKSIKKLKLHRETVSHLDPAVLNQAAGAGITLTTCVSSPLYCFYTGVKQTCVE
jgi:hypothetical protein